MGKRGNGEGSIYQLRTGPRKGTWKVVVTISDRDGRKKRVTRNTKSKADAAAVLAKLRGDTPIIANRQTTEQFIESWLTDHVAAHKSPATLTLWTGVARNHIYGRIGFIQFSRLRPVDVQRFVDGMVNDGVPSRSRQVAFQVLRKALRHAKKLDLIADNPSIEIERPNHEPKEIFPFSEAQAVRLMQITEGTRWHALIVLTITGGFRQGELWGLEWSAVDLKRKVVFVRQAAAEVLGKVSIRKTKTRAGNRTVELTDNAVAALEAHRAILLREGHASKPAVFPAPEGGLMSRSTFASRYWKPLLAKLGFELRGFHHTRHTYAALQIAAGVPINVISKIMGHAKPSTTLDLYGHLMPDQQKAATEAMKKRFG